jgi:transcriptional regulator with GAF, ATPase, and Fis domain
VLDQITLVAPNEANVLVRGKELVARAIHEP